MNQTLIVMVGLPRSGKSTYIEKQKWLEKYPVICPDSFRLAIHGQRFYKPAEPFVWGAVQATIKALFLRGHKTIILDATNTTHSRRKEWEKNEWAVKYVWIKTSPEECKRRALATEQEDLIPVIEYLNESSDPFEPDQEVEIIECKSRKV